MYVEPTEGRLSYPPRDHGLLGTNTYAGASLHRHQDVDSWPGSVAGCHVARPAKRGK
jgi:hypothetical protein